MGSFGDWRREARKEHTQQGDQQEESPHEREGGDETGHAKSNVKDRSRETGWHFKKQEEGIRK